MKFTLFSLLAFLALPAWGTAQETYPYPDVWRTAGTHLLPPDRVKALIGWIGPGVKHRDGGCFPLPTWGTGNRADEAAAELVLVGTPAIDALIPLLRDQEAGRRQMVVEIFGRIGNRRVTPLLTPLLQSEKDDSVRESVA
ncbi:MAG: hypothetical protein JWN14_484, partial [Chthonomonadales bacterium]|nr:hypothetical protein [Chthonomonadales bacterium]